jgi:L-histidine Nalpha-methyltransferase
MRSAAADSRVRVVVVRDDRGALVDATLLGLRSEPKELPPVWLYDERGSRLYERITRLPEYYLPPREREILGARAGEVAVLTQAQTLVELGAGGARNTRFLLDALAAAGTLEEFVPLDVSEQMLRASAQGIADAYPAIFVQALVGDFERDLDALPRAGRRLIALLGSTLGNFDPKRRARFLSAVATVLGDEDALLLGVDLVKDVAQLQAAYDDAAGVTEAFVRNALTSVNRELDADFDQRRFAYDPRWDPEEEWMEIALRAREAHVVSVAGLELDVPFETGERLRVEISAKFRREAFAAEAGRAALGVDGWWTDRAGEFAVALLSRRTPG